MTNWFSFKLGKNFCNFSGNKGEKLSPVNFFSIILPIVAKTKAEMTVQIVVIKKCLITSNLNFLYNVQKPIFSARIFGLGGEFFWLFVIKLY
jgi:hypothetical protein